MKYLQEIGAAHNDPKQLEELYQTARRANETGEFTNDLLTCHVESPHNILYAAWYYRLQQTPQEDRARRSINWKLAIPLSVITGLIFWILSISLFEASDGVPYLILVWAPISACFALAFLAITSGRHRKLSLLTAIGLIGVVVYVTLFTTLQQRSNYRDLMRLHLPLLAWIGTGLGVLGLRSDHQNRFLFLTKSLEAFITGGLYSITGGVFAGITFGLFAALGVIIPEAIMRLLAAGGAGLIPVLAIASVYDPHVSPTEQDFKQGLSKLISTMMRLLLPLTLLVLIVNVLFISFNFMEPFRNRDVLIVYNVMLFAIMGLFIGAAPVHRDALLPQQSNALRKGILAVAILTVLISLYALSATVYRTIAGGITINRLTVVGWNSINIGILSALIYKQFKDGPTAWVRSLQSVFSKGIVAYIVWAAFLILAIPWLFNY